MDDSRLTVTFFFIAESNNMSDAIDTVNTLVDMDATAFAPPENLSLRDFETLVDEWFGDLDFEPSMKTAVYYGLKLVPGDHIAVEFKGTEHVSPWHHGIFVGKEFDGKLYPQHMVVDTSKTSKTLRMTPMKEFGNNVFRIDYQHDDIEGLKDIRCKRACIMATWALHNLERFQYDILANNCEHFATWCSTNAMRQVHMDILPHYSSSYLSEKAHCLVLRNDCRSEQIQKVLARLAEILDTTLKAKMLSSNSCTLL